MGLKGRGVGRMKYFNKFSLERKVSIVTGGGQGIGRVISEALCEAGSKVAILEINEATGRKAEEELNRAGYEAAFLKTNVLEEQEVEHAVSNVIQKFGGLDVLINNVGDGMRLDTQDMSYDDWKKIVALCLNGTFLMSKAAVRQKMIAQKSGSIINISSMSGVISNNPAGQSAYNAAKAGVIHFTKSTAGEWARYNIRVNTIAPGFMKTDQTKSVFEENGYMAKRWMEFTPMGRPGTPDELAGAALYFASDASTYTTGACLLCDGGYSVW
jgi:NAD(P)-dependent dehydrogenase (short-subunit alcohol dehydrogenase family)